ncbi:unnamed protein product [Choristocarpus tenellus]
MVGGRLQPVNIPETNVPRTVLDDMASRQEESDGSPARQVAQKAAASKDLKIKGSDTHGVGLFAVKDIKAGDFIDISCFGTFVVYDTENLVHDAIVTDGVPRYMVTNDVASMCVGGEVSRPHAALFLVPPRCLFLSLMNSCRADLEKANVERHSKFIPTNWSLEKGSTGGRDGGARARKGPLWEALSYPPNTLKFRLTRDIVAGEELLHKYFFPGSRAGGSESSDDEDEDEEES